MDRLRIGRGEVGTGVSSSSLTETELRHVHVVSWLNVLIEGRDSTWAEVHQEVQTLCAAHFASVFTVEVVCRTRSSDQDGEDFLPGHFTPAPSTVGLRQTEY